MNGIPAPILFPLSFFLNIVGHHEDNKTLFPFSAASPQTFSSIYSKLDCAGHAVFRHLVLRLATAQGGHFKKKACQIQEAIK